MKKPIADQELRWMMIHLPDSVTALLCRLSIDLKILIREIHRVLVPLIAKITPYIGLEIRRSYKKYVK